MTDENWKELGSLTDDYDAENRRRVFEAIRVAGLLGRQVLARHVVKEIPAIPAEGERRGQAARQDISIQFWAANPKRETDGL